MALYSAPTARIRVNGLLFRSVILSNSMHQVCTLSLYLYILAMEHLAVALRSNATIQGVQVGDTPQKLSLFVDDLLMHYPCNNFLLHVFPQYPCFIRDWEKELGYLLFIDDKSPFLIFKSSLSTQTPKNYYKLLYIVQDR